MAKTHLYAQFCFFWFVWCFWYLTAFLHVLEKNIAKHMTSACALEQGRCIRLGMAVSEYYAPRSCE